jgi:hypothetical protein
MGYSKELRGRRRVRTVDITVSRDFVSTTFHRVDCNGKTWNKSYHRSKWTTQTMKSTLERGRIAQDIIHE